MKVTLNTTSFDRQLAALLSKAPIAIARAINRGAPAARTVLVRDTAKDLRLKVGVVRDRTSLSQATAAKPAATIHASTRRIPALEFNAKGPEPSRGKGRGVSTRLPGGRFPRAFIATMRSGHRGVFQRLNKTRLPIVELHGPSVAQVAQKHTEAAAQRFLEQAAKTLQHEISRVLGTKA